MNAARRSDQPSPVPKPGSRAKPQPLPEAAPSRRFHIPTLSTLSVDLRVLLLNLCLLVILVVMIPVVGQQFLRAQVIIDSLAVPPTLAARGLGAEVAANRLSDGLSQIEAEASSSKPGVTAVPKSQRVDFQVPDSGISIDSLVYYVRQFFHLYPTRIGGEFLCADADCHPQGMSLRIRILRDKLLVIQMPPMGKQTEAAYFRAAALRILVELDPFLAAAVEVQSNPVAGLAHAERLVRLGGPDAIWAYNLIGNTQMTMGQTDAAIAAFQGALALDPGFVIAQTNLGSALVAKGDLAGAAAVFDTVAKTHPQDRYLALGRYRLALAQGQTDAAIAQALKADAEDPGKATYLAMAAQAAFGAGQQDKAIGYLQRALQVAPDDDLAVSLSNLIHEQAGDYAAAETVLRAALALSPDNTDFLSTLAQVLGQLHRYDEGLAQLDHLLTLTPGDKAAQKVRASLLQATGRHQDALVQLQALAGPDTRDVGLLFMQGQSLQALGQKDAAAKAYQTVITLDPDSTDAQMAKVYLQTLK